MGVQCQTEAAESSSLSQCFIFMFSDLLQCLFPSVLYKCSTVHQWKPELNWIKQKVIY